MCCHVSVPFSLRLTACIACLQDFVTRDIYLDSQPFEADGDVWLSPETRLLADRPGVQEFVFDGKSHSLILPEGIMPQEPLPLILVGTGKTLRFKNVRIINALSLSSVIQLQSGGKGPSVFDEMPISAETNAVLFC